MGKRVHCGDCAYWNEQSEPGPDRVGECRRLPPRPVVLDEIQGHGTWADWPQTYAFDWCGMGESADGQA